MILLSLNWWKKVKTISVNPSQCPKKSLPSMIGMTLSSDWSKYLSKLYITNLKSPSVFLSILKYYSIASSLISAFNFVFDWFNHFKKSGISPISSINCLSSNFFSMASYIGFESMLALNLRAIILAGWNALNVGGINFLAASSYMSLS